LFRVDPGPAIGLGIEAPVHAEKVDVTGKILTPGFINTHSHMYQTALRALSPNAILAQYSFNYSPWSPVSRSCLPGDVYISSLGGYIEGFAGGVTTCIDHAHKSWSLDADMTPRMIVERGFGGVLVLRTMKVARLNRPSITWRRSTTVPRRIIRWYR